MRARLTFNARRCSLEERRLGRLLYPDLGVARPRTRGDCIHGPRPCPWVGCRHHLLLDILPSGNLRELPPRDGHSCALDAADEGPLGAVQIAELLGVTREAVRLVLEAALLKLRASSKEP